MVIIWISLYLYRVLKRQHYNIEQYIWRCLRVVCLHARLHRARIEVRCPLRAWFSRSHVITLINIGWAQCGMLAQRVSAPADWDLKPVSKYLGLQYSPTPVGDYHNEGNINIDFVCEPYIKSHILRGLLDIVTMTQHLVRIVTMSYGTRGALWSNIIKTFFYLGHPTIHEYMNSLNRLLVHYCCYNLWTISILLRLLAYCLQ